MTATRWRPGRGSPVRPAAGRAWRGLCRAAVLVLPAALASATLAQGSAVPSLPPLVDGSALGNGWRVALLPAQKPPPTRFTPETVDGRAALRLEAQASYGNLLHETAAGAPPRLLQWAWRLQQPNPDTDLRRKTGDDVAAKVCVSFDLPLSRLPLGERLLLQLARARTGEALPAATLCWVWGGAELPGSVVDNVFSRRVRYIVLRNAADATGTWFDESRDIGADFTRAFGDEAAAPPQLLAVGVGADADNTGRHSIAHVTALRFAP